jgi:SnoaL-like protein
VRSVAVLVLDDGGKLAVEGRCWRRMSRENVDLFRRTVEAYNARDIEAFIGYFDPDVEFHSSFAGVGAVYRGHAGLRRWHRDLEEAWGGEICTEPAAYFDLGEYTLTLSVLRSRGRTAGWRSKRLMCWSQGGATAASST